jgi:hypothetical protein
MNERLKQLMQEAGYAAPELANRANKLAELIVQECILTIQMGITRDGHNTEKYLRSIKHIKQIQEHFGVEEQEKVVPKPKCSVCGTTENVKYMGGHQPYMCDSEDCIPF